MALMLGACEKKESERKQETMKVTVERVSEDAQFGVMPYVGTVEPEQTTMVSFTGMAILKSIYVSEGQQVRKGQLLATIDDTQARNALAAAASQLAQAQDAQKRMKQLYENKSLPDMKWVEVESKVQQAEASYQMSKKALEDCSIYAPCNGVVGDKIMGVGETVLPTQPVLTILSINNVKVRVSIPEKEISTIQPNSVSHVFVEALPGESFHSQKIEKGVSADAVTHTYDVRICLPNPERRLLPGMVAQVEILPDSAQMAILTLPVKAVQQAADRSLFVWMVKDGKAQRNAVTVGRAVGNRIHVTSGLKNADQVIVDGYQKVSDGMPVTY